MRTPRDCPIGCRKITQEGQIVPRKRKPRRAKSRSSHTSTSGMMAEYQRGKHEGRGRAGYQRRRKSPAVKLLQLCDEFNEHFSRTNGSLSKRAEIARGSGGNIDGYAKCMYMTRFSNLDADYAMILSPFRSNEQSAFLVHNANNA